MAIEALRDITRASTSAFAGGAGIDPWTSVQVLLSNTPRRSGRVSISIPSELGNGTQYEVEIQDTAYQDKGTTLFDEGELAGPIQLTSNSMLGALLVRWTSSFLQRGYIPLRYRKN